MGVVYRARDTRLGRDVALKFLGVFARDSNSFDRFRREARSASGINHPNICTVYDIDEHEGEPFLVMELLDGTTLKHRIGGRPVPLQDFLDWAVQIADALQAAHAKGIIHRDVKPANIFITNRGQPKLLDFGLAKKTHRARTPALMDATTSVVADFETGPGLTLGTISHMSPEQARGEDIDERSDIFSLGVVLYEMATGRQAFTGATSAVIFDAILNRPPVPPLAFNPALPPRLADVIERCVEKDRALRYQSASDLLADLQRIRRSLTSSVPSGSSALTAVAQPRVRRQFRSARWPVRIIAVAAGLLACIWVARFAGRYTGERDAAFKPVPLTTYIGSEYAPTFSPDGNQVAFSWAGETGQNRDIYIAPLDGGQPLRLTTDSAFDNYPKWSRDGRQIAFIRNPGSKGAIYTIAATGGPEKKIADTRGWSVDWTPAGDELVAVDRVSLSDVFNVWVVSVVTGQKRQISFFRGRPEGDAFAALSADGKSVAFSRKHGGQSHVFLVPFSGGEPLQLTAGRNAGITGLAWMPDGRSIIFSAGGRLLRVPVDSDASLATELTGIDTNAGFPAISRNPPVRLAYEHGIRDDNLRKVRLRADKVLTAEAGFVTTWTSRELAPQFSPDGASIAFASDRSGNFEIWKSRSDGSDATRLTSFRGEHSGSPRWSPDGRKIVFDHDNGSGKHQLYVIEANGGSLRLLTREDLDAVKPTWSRDGEWIYFSSTKGRSQQIWKIRSNSNESQSPVQVTQNGGVEAFESLDGKTLYYVGGDKPGLWSVTPQGGQPQLIEPSVSLGAWSVAADGIYFVDYSGASVRIAPRPIKRIDFKSGKVVELGKTPGSIAVATPGFSVKHDGSEALYSSVDRLESDLKLVEDFR